MASIDIRNVRKNFGIVSVLLLGWRGLAALVSKTAHRAAR